MKQRAMTTLLISFSIILSIAVSLTTAQQISTEEVVKNICGAWVNTTYSGDEASPQKIVFKSDRTYEIYGMAFQESPTNKGDFNILECWKDAGGCTYCKATMKSIYSANSSFELWKLNTSGNTWESKSTFTWNTFAKESEPHPDTSAVFRYSNYTRRLNAPVLPVQNGVKVEDYTVYIYATVNGKPLKAFVFQPEGERDSRRRPAIALLHGGGWAIGEAGWAFGLAKHFSSLGMVSVAIQYRLSDQLSITPLEAMADVRAAIRWMRSNAAKLGIDPEQIAAYGWSAGAHLAASAAIFDDTTQSTTERCVPDALVLISPAVFLEADTWPQQLLGARADVSSISPATHVRNNLPPTLVLEGRRDTVTPFNGVWLFCSRMRNAGNRCDLHVFERVGHLFTPDSLRDDQWPKPDPNVEAEALKKVDEFLVSLGFIK
jgi:acetyl esterase/lipase